MNRSLIANILLLAVIGVALALLFAKGHFNEAIVINGQSATVYPAVVLALTNADRITGGVPILTENALLDQAAQMKADDMVAQGYYAHENPQGYQMFYWVDKVGYKYLNLGENLDLSYVATNEVVNAAWMGSPEHRDNILRPQFTETGVGVATGTYEGQEATFVVQLFGTPLPDTLKPPVIPVTRSVSPSTATAKTAPVKTPAKTSAPKIATAQSTKQEPTTTVQADIPAPSLKAAISFLGTLEAQTPLPLAPQPLQSENAPSAFKLFVDAIGAATQQFLLSVYSSHRSLFPNNESAHVLP